jgi:hypothetical protein
MPTTSPRRLALYARVSTTEQTADNQILELRTYAKPERGPSPPSTSMKASPAAPPAGRGSTR